MIDLSAAGLSQTEAKTYQKLLEAAEWQPSKLAISVGETRTNIYKLLDNLVKLGLAKKYDKSNKLHYSATNPSHLLELARKAREDRLQSEKSLELQTEELMREYIKTHEQPGVRFFQGKDQIVEIFDEFERSTDEIVFIHTTAGINFYSYEFMHKMRMKAVHNKVPRRGLTPDTKLATVDYVEKDKLVHLTRTWLRAQDYTAPVEWGAFEDKLYVISYGVEALGMIVESPQMAQSFKQIFALLERGQQLLPDYEKLPKLAQKIGVTK